MDHIKEIFYQFSNIQFKDVIVAVIIFIIGWAFQYFFLHKIILLFVRLIEKKSKPIYAKILEQFIQSIRYAFLTIILYLSLSFVFNVWLFGKKIPMNILYSLMVVFLFKGFYNLLSYHMNLLNSSPAKQKNLFLYPLFIRMLKAVLFIASLFVIASFWNFNMNGFLTGLGLTSVALAFGVREPLTHIFSGLSVTLDKPFKIGDWVSADDNKFEGIVEDINLRSTRIITRDKTSIYIPNSYFVNKPIFNYSNRKKRNIKFHLYLDVHTSEKQLRTMMSRIKQVIINHPNTTKENIFITLDEFTQTSIAVLISYYVNSNEHETTIKTKGEINLSIRKILEGENIFLATSTATPSKENN